MHLRLVNVQLFAEELSEHLLQAAALHGFINSRISGFQGGVARRAAARAADGRCFLDHTR